MYIGTSVTYDLVISEKGTEIRNQKKTGIYTFWIYNVKEG